jgi:uncharacterized protein with ATP-grasp and redox domains
MALARQLGNEEQATRFFRALIQLFLDAPEGVSAPWYAPQTARLLQEIYGLDFDRYKEEKRRSNAFVLARMEQIRKNVESAADPVFAGLQHAILGNYIDFSALRDQVSFDKLDEMLLQALKMELDEKNYTDLQNDFAKGQRLLYITDNAGEIGFDRIFAEQIAKKYPHLQITFLVRGGPANNDALIEDALAMEIPFRVIGNGNCIPGTQLDQLSHEAKAAMDSADVIISKGQGNVETLYGCGYNIYYAFLVKCPRFEILFSKEKLTPMLVKERSVQSCF